MAQSAPKEESDFSLIMQRIRETEWNVVKNVSTLDSEATYWLDAIQSNGSWLDIDYSNTAQTGWTPLAHLDRLKKMALAYTLSTSSLYGDSTLFAGISRGLNKWYVEDPRSSNWYNQQIACPQRVGVILILMRSGKQQLTSTLETKLFSRMEEIGGRPDQSGSQGTGANKIDIATHWVYRGCLKEDEDVLSFGVEQVYYPVFTTTGEGLQSDFAYFQHGQQLFNGGYGISFVNGVARIANFTVGTQYALSDEKLDLLTTFTREGYLNLIRGKYYLYNVIGRGLSRPGALNASSAVDMTGLTGNLDVSHAAEYEAAIKRLKGEETAGYGMHTGQKHFWRGDYSLYFSPGYTFDVRMASTRTYRNENGNGENVKGYFLSEGAHSIAVDGDEYLDIFPVWNWTRIPGITAPQKTSVPQPAQWGTYGTSNFAGGVSNGQQGITVFALNNNEYSINTAARKAWFMFGDEIVCLGADIASTALEEINTTVNQCLAKGDVTVFDGDNEITPVTGTHTSLAADKIYHNKVGYIFPRGGNNINLSCESKTGNWSAINSTYSASETKDVFTLWLNHGVKPIAAIYEFIIVPNKTKEEIKAYNADDIEVLVNSDSLQVVRKVSQNLWGFVFYKAASFSNADFTLKAGNSCVVMLEDPDEASVSGWLADPSQIKKRISLRFVSAAFSAEKELDTELPQTPYAGSTVAFVIDSSTPDYDSTQAALHRIYAVDDAYVRDGSYGNTNYGTDGLIVKQDNADGYRRQFFLKFNLAELNPDTIDRVDLQLTVANANTNISATQWELYYVSNDTWTESTLTFNNKPAASMLLGSFPGSPAGTQVIYDLTQTIKDELAKTGDTHLSLNLVSTQRGDGKTDASFFSKETGDNDTRPYLLIESKKATTSLQTLSAPATLRMAGNPVHRGSEAVLLYNAETKGNATVRIYDVFGRELSQREVVVIADTKNRILLGTAQFDAGLYFVSVNGDTVRMVVE